MNGPLHTYLHCNCKIGTMTISSVSLYIGIPQNCCRVCEITTSHLSEAPTYHSLLQEHCAPENIAQLRKSRPNQIHLHGTPFLFQTASLDCCLHVGRRTLHIYTAYLLLQIPLKNAGRSSFVLQRRLRGCLLHCCMKGNAPKAAARPAPMQASKGQSCELLFLPTIKSQCVQVPK